MNPKPQLRYLMELTFFNPEHSNASVKENLLLGVVSCKGDTAVLSYGINSIEVCLHKKSVTKKKSKIEPNDILESNSLYIFKDCCMKMEIDVDSIKFELNFNGTELIMPYYFATKEKTFKPLIIDLSLKDHQMLKRKVI